MSSTQEQTQSLKGWVRPLQLRMITALDEFSSVFDLYSVVLSRPY